MPRRVDRDELRILVKGGPRSGGEVLQAGADGDDHVRLLGNRVGAVRSGHTDGPDVQRMLCQHVGASGDGLDHGDVVSFGEGGQFVDSARVLHATARDDHGTFGVAKGCDRIGDLGCVRRLATNAVHLLFKEFDRVVIGPALHILRKAKECRAAIGRVQHGGDCCGQRLNHLRRVADTIPVAADRLERVIHAESWIIEILHLLQHGVGQAGQECISA